MYDKNRIKEDLSCIEAAESLNIKMAPGSRTERKIICPAHNDRHFGSCICKVKKWYCFACGAGGDVYSLICASEGCSFSESIQIAAELTGHPDNYLISGDVEYKPEYKCPITVEDLNLLGLNKKISIPIERGMVLKGESYAPEKFIREEEYNGLTWVVYGNYEHISIFDEYEEDPEYFNFLINSTADVEIAKREAILEYGVSKLLPQIAPEFIYGIQMELKRELVKIKNIKNKI